MIIPFFIPNAACKHQCIFCDQKAITGEKRPPSSSEIPAKIDEYLRTKSRIDPVQIAFYGGSFTALPLAVQQSYLEAIQPFIQSKQIQTIRISTRPDCITTDILLFLKKYHVTIVELGAQSLNNDILKRSGRGHTADDTIKSFRLLKEYGFSCGLQVMVGLPGDSKKIFEQTITTVIKMTPDFIRLYPLLVIKGTRMEKEYNDGKYEPLSLENAVSVCKNALRMCRAAEIPVIRIGLQPTEELEQHGTIIAGPYHPAFRQLVESAIFLEEMQKALAHSNETGKAIFYVHPLDLSAALGQNRSNVVQLEKEFKRPVLIVPNKTIKKRGSFVTTDKHG
ncbi:MAG: radical SAM protein [Nitrospirota bacterium]